MKFNIPMQMLCLDKRQELWTKNIAGIQSRGYEIHPFVVGDGEHSCEYDRIDEPAENMGWWGYGVAGIKHRHWNAFLSHHEMIQRAIDNKWPRFLMLEDDCYLTKRFESITEEPTICDFIHNNEYDLLYCGWWIGRSEKNEWNMNIENAFNENSSCGIDKVDSLNDPLGGLHGVIIDESMYEYILNLPATNPIDAQLGLIHNQIKSYFVYPKVIHTVSCYSNCEDTFLERDVL